MKHYLTPEETGACRTVDSAVRDAKKAVDSLFVTLATNQPPGGWPDGIVEHVRKACETAKAALGSLDFTPQSEWMGGNSQDETNFKMRRPDGFRRFGVH